MSDTPNLALPLIAAAQAQKHVPHNEALFAIDALLQCAVLDKDRSAPPPSPAEGVRYIVGPGASGAWAGHGNAVAAWQDGAWSFHGPNAGFLVFVADESLLYVYTSSGGWVPLASTLSTLQNLALLGIGTTADPSNPLSAKLNAALWTARTAGEGGTGDLRYTLNKEAAGNVLSFLFQTGYSGRLEFGLIGSDNPALKVSQTGSGWATALSVDSGTGGLDFLSASSDLGSAATVDLGAVTTRKARITGTAAITSFGTAVHKERLLAFAGALTLTHNATSLILPGAANIVTAAGDTAYATSDAAGNWTVRHYGRASGGSVVAQTPATISASGLMAATDKLNLDLLSSTTSLVPNGNFENGLLGWAPVSVGGATVLLATDSNVYGGSQGAVFDRGTSASGSAYSYLSSALIAVEPNTDYEVIGFFKGDTATAAGCYLRCNWFKYDKVTATTVAGTRYPFGGISVPPYSDAINNGPIATTYTKRGGTVSSPPDASFVRIDIYHYSSSTTRYMWADAISLRRAVSASLIEGGAVANGNLSPVATATIKGRSSAGIGSPEDLSATQARTVLGLATTDSPAFGGLTLSAPAKVGVYTVATLPTAGTAGRTAFASNGRAFNGAGTLETAGAGTGTLVADSGSAWKVAGTNQTVAA